MLSNNKADRMYRAIHALMVEIANRADESRLNGEMFLHLIPQAEWDEARAAAYAYYLTRKDVYFEVEGHHGEGTNDQE